MRKVLSSAVTSLSLLLLLVCACTGQTTDSTERPPAVPLVTHDPYFSIWSMADKLTDQNTKHWTGTEQPLTGLIRIDGTTYRYMGARPRRGVPAMAQTALNVSFTHTDYTFEQAGIRLTTELFHAGICRRLRRLIAAGDLSHLESASPPTEARTRPRSIWTSVRFWPSTRRISRLPGVARASMP